MSKNISNYWEFEGEDNIKCPFCEHVDLDSFEVHEDKTESMFEVECENCGKVFEAIREVSTTYSSYFKENENE